LIEARSGDRIVVHVRNDLEDEGVSLHWHGLLLRNQNDMDGAVGFTQDPIPPGNFFAYNFTVGDDEHGTFWWHSHSDLQRADGLWGGLVVHNPADVDTFEQDYLIMVGDWFHRNQSEVLSWYADPSSRGNEPVPDSLLVNGQGRFDCSRAVPTRPLNCSQIAQTELKPLFKSAEGSMRLRVVNTGSVAGFSVSLEGATVKPVAIDGGFNVQSEAVETVGVLYPGQRVDFSVRWDSYYTDSRQLIIYMDEE
jgi:FtsP/CotA-like multicopper oxidase with cupredoxin domain